jgi:hypothetical protein
MARSQHYTQSRSDLFIQTTTRHYPNYLLSAISDLYDPETHNFSTKTRTELQSEITDLGLDVLQFHEGLSKYGKQWDSLRHSAYGSSPEFMQMEIQKNSYPLIHPGKKKTMFSTKMTKEQLSGIAERCKLDLGCLAVMAQTFGAKQMFDNILKDGKGTIPRPVVYEMITKEIENFNKFIEIERLILTLKTTELFIWDESIHEIQYV